MNEYNKRIESESRSIIRITNSDLICKNCLFQLNDTEKFANTSQCKQFSIKPNRVLVGKDCSKFRMKGSKYNGSSKAE